MIVQKGYINPWDYYEEPVLVTYHYEGKMVEVKFTKYVSRNFNVYMKSKGGIPTRNVDEVRIYKVNNYADGKLCYSYLKLLLKGEESTFDLSDLKKVFDDYEVIEIIKDI
jgi:hypothetical protein